MTPTATYTASQGIFGIRHSYADTERRFATPDKRRQIKYGDRLFARIVMHGRTILEFMIAQVNDFSELIGELRRQCRGKRGLARLYVRNMSRGWSVERPMMLYSGPDIRNAAAETPVSGTPRSRVERYTIKDHQGLVRQLSFPWDL